MIIQDEVSFDLEFTEDLFNELTLNDFNLIVSNKILKKNFAGVSSSKYKVNFLVPSSNKTGNLIVIFTKQIFSKNYSRLENMFLSAQLIKVKLEIESKEIKKFASTGNSITLGITLSLGLLSIDLSSFFNFLNIFELISIISLFDLNIPEEILELLRNLRVQKAVSSSLQNLFSFAETLNTNELYVKYGYDSNSFIINSGNSLILFFAIVFSFIIQKIFLGCALKKVPKLLLIKEYFEYNIFFKYWIQTSLELLLTTTYGFNFFDYKDNLSIIDFIMSLLVFVILT